MRRSTRLELAKLRELAHFLLQGKCCFFCKKPLITTINRVPHGDGNGSPINRLITIHHVDGDHSNDARSNKRLVHTTCHKAYNMRRLWKQGRLKPRKSEIVCT